MAGLITPPFQVVDAAAGEATAWQAYRLMYACADPTIVKIIPPAKAPIIA
jgi:hypothetical protein